MANTREIQSRMKSIKDTMKITSAMYMISSNKLKKAKLSLEHTEPYFYAMQSGMARILRQERAIRREQILPACSGGRMCASAFINVARAAGRLSSEGLLDRKDVQALLYNYY